jgi:hypothetical protein
LSEPALTLSFFDPSHRLSGTVRAGMALLFQGPDPIALREPPLLERAGDGWRARLGDRLALDFSPQLGPLELDGAAIRLCRVSGSVEGNSVSCLGTAGEAPPPAWAELDALRAISAIFDEQNAVFALARRPLGAAGHGAESVAAALVVAGEAAAIEEARISTVYDGDGRQRSAGIELWLDEEDFPRRVSGTAEAGASLAFEGLRVDAAVFHWRMEGRDGYGAYELATRDDREAA